jgi:carboxylesterase
MGEGSPAPIEISGDPPAVLALHGFGGTPLEIALVVDVAKELGLRAFAPLLPGHGTHARELMHTNWKDWSRASNVALDRLVKPGSRVIVVGLSLGSLLAAHLAATRQSDVLAIGMLANATRLTPLTTSWPLRIIEKLGLPDFGIPKAGADIQDPAARATHLTYNLQRVRGAMEVMRAGARVEKILGDIHCPAFIAHGRLDHVCPVANAERVAKKLGSADKTVVILERSAHIITRDYDRETLGRELRRFLGRISGRGGGALRGSSENRTGSLHGP